MANYDFTSLSPVDFEDLCADLLERREGEALSRYRVGRDKGIDAGTYRFESNSGVVVQCKHYVKSGFAKLLSNLEDVELPKVVALQPDRYIVMTSVPLNPSEKHKISTALAPYVLAYEDILGSDDLNALLRAYPDVERKHFKLWMQSTGVLRRVLHNAGYERAETFFEDLAVNLRRFVASDAVKRAVEMLDDTHLCVLAGIPGIGKTTLAQVLCAQLSERGYEVVVVSSDISEALDLWNPDSKQVFYYDDFLGTSTLAESLGKNEDQQLGLFMKRVERTPNKRMVMTTREYILTAAYQLYDKLGDAPIDFAKVTVSLQDYSDHIRAQILFNHLWFSEFDGTYLAPFVEERRYMDVIGHDNYNPRLIAEIVDLALKHAVPAEDFGAFFLRNLAHPARLYNHTYEQQVTVTGRAILRALWTLSGETDLDRLWTATESQLAGSSFSEIDFDQALKALEGTFIRTRQRRRMNALARRPSGVTARGMRTVIEVTWASPAINDFVALRLAENRAELLATVKGASAFDQLETLARLASRAKPVEESGPGAALASAAHAQVQPIIERLRELLGIPVEPGGELSPFDRQRVVSQAYFMVELFADEAFEADQRAALARTLGVIWSGPQYWSVNFEHLRLASWLGDHRATCPDCMDALAKLKTATMSRLRDDPSDYLIALGLSEIDGLFSEEELEELEENFTTAFERELEELEWQDPDTIEDLNALASQAENLRAAADEFGIDDTRLDDLETKIDELRGEIPDYEPEYDRDDWMSERSSSDDSIDAMFGDLLN